jgi:hypothetical protein
MFMQRQNQKERRRKSHKKIKEVIRCQADLSPFGFKPSMSLLRLPHGPKQVSDMAKGAVVEFFNQCSLYTSLNELLTRI